MGMEEAGLKNDRSSMIKHVVLRPPRLDFIFVLGLADPKHGGQLDGLVGHADNGLLYSEKLLR